MYADSSSYRSGRFADWPLALKSILGFWLFYYATVVVRAFLGHDPGTVLLNRAYSLAFGIALTAVIYVVLSLLAGGASLKRRIVIGLIASLLAGASQSLMLIGADSFLDKPQDEFRFTSREGYTVVETGNEMRIERDGAEPLILTWPRVTQLHQWDQFRIALDMAVTWSFFFAAWSAFYIAMLAQADALGARRRAAEAESAARAAQ